MWFHETLFEDVKLGLQGKLLYSKKTGFQDMKIFQTPAHGRLLLLDGTIQTTEKDEFIYHEMLTHPLLLAHPNPEKVLIIGAGDGGILREVLKHPVKEAAMVEIDGDVIEFSKKYLPSLSKGAFDDPRARIIIDDGAKFVRETKEKFDVVIVDSPDPIGCAKVLFSKKFYRDIYNCMSADGMMIRQAGSTMYQFDELIENYRLLKRIFPITIVELAAIPTYVGGFFSLLIGSKKIHPGRPMRTVRSRYRKLKLKTKYYNPEIHVTSQALPNFVKEVTK